MHNASNLISKLIYVSRPNYITSQVRLFPEIGKLNLRTCHAFVSSKFLRRVYKLQ